MANLGFAGESADERSVSPSLNNFAKPSRLPTSMRRGRRRSTWGPQQDVRAKLTRTINKEPVVDNSSCCYYSSSYIAKQFESSFYKAYGPQPKHLGATSAASLDPRVPFMGFQRQMAVKQRQAVSPVPQHRMEITRPVPPRMPVTGKPLCGSVKADGQPWAGLAQR